jgi:serine/threonine-protein phosphatase 2B catalytic subunit
MITIKLGKEANLVKIGEPIVIVGDLHGQFYDLVHMLEKAGDPSEINYLFLGDYVDRGIFGIEVVLTLLCIKVLYSINISFSKISLKT